MSKRELKDLGPALAYRPTHRGPTVTARVSTGPPAPRKKEAVADVNQNKRPRRAAADAASGALDGADTAVAELKDVHASQSIALTSHDALAAMLWPAHTVVVTLHTSERPSCLPGGVVHIGAAFDDRADFDDVAMTRRLDRLCAYTWAADAARVVFVCHAGVNRSSLALCYYLQKYGLVGWQQAKDALVAAKRGAASGWPTLENGAFVAYLARHFGSAASSSAVGDGAASAPAAATPVAPPPPRWFWRTVATARPSTGGTGADPEEAARRRQEADERMRSQGVDPRTGRTWGCWERGRPGGIWVRGVPGQRRPWGECG